jgi:tripartite-type tricarboxylate transporter receptor subunit TctC
MNSKTDACGASTNTVLPSHREINGGLADSVMQSQLAELGSMVFASSPAEIEKHIAEETKKWGKVVKFSGARPD